MIEITMSKHAKEDRLERLTAIAMNVGIGDRIVIEAEFEGKKYSITDTGVLLIKTVDTNCLITAYLATVKQARGIAIHCGKKAIPSALYNKIKHNEKYRKECQ